MDGACLLMGLLDLYALQGPLFGGAYHCGSTSHKYTFFLFHVTTSHPTAEFSTTQNAIIGILNAAEGHPVSDDGISTCLCVVLKENSRSKPYKSHPFNLAQILGEKWNNSSTYQDIFGKAKPDGEECKAAFCKMFGLEPARVDIKKEWTLVFALQEGGTIDQKI